MYYKYTNTVPTPTKDGVGTVLIRSSFGFQMVF